ncbi:MAG: UbiD family decarboxylase, partial [Woeseiaceae bacterium]
TDVDIFDVGDVEWAVATRCRHDKDLVFLPESDGHRLNPMVESDRWVRLGIDATVPLPKEEKYVRVTMQDVDLSTLEIDD